MTVRKETKLERDERRKKDRLWAEAVEAGFTELQADFLTRRLNQASLGMPMYF